MLHIQLNHTKTFSYTVTAFILFSQGLFHLLIWLPYENTPDLFSISLPSCALDIFFISTQRTMLMQCRSLQFCFVLFQVTITLPGWLTLHSSPLQNDCKQNLHKCVHVSIYNITANWYLFYLSLICVQALPPCVWSSQCKKRPPLPRGILHQK